MVARGEVQRGLAGSRQLPKGRSFWGENAKDPRNSPHSVLTAMPACRVPSGCVAVGAHPLRKDDFAVIRGGASLAEPRCHVWRPRELIDNKFLITHGLESLAYPRLLFKKLPSTGSWHRGLLLYPQLLAAPAWHGIAVRHPSGCMTPSCSTQQVLREFTSIRQWPG